jgi:hypothetical protein
MFEIPLLLALVTTLCVLVLVLIVGYKKYNQWNDLIKENKKKREEALLVDLELATTDQLFEELQKRPQQPYLLVRPDNTGVRVESHNIPPVPTAHILTAAAFIVQKSLAQQGIDFDGPKFTMGDDENPFSTE